MLHGSGGVGGAADSRISFTAACCLKQKEQESNLNRPIVVVVIVACPGSNYFLLPLQLHPNPGRSARCNRVRTSANGDARKIYSCRHPPALTHRQDIRAT